ncbi:hypothetical protein HJC23_014091 [Cyclotella cryptica]|uniref:Uncharacterized protein n=1 Tax=Cyclotella cryptica TaxID=29204 RepID=A0ABD3QTQ4_9STRA
MLVKSTSDLFERMDNKRKQHPAHDDVEDDRGASIANKSQRVLTLRELIPPKQFRKSNASHARSLRLADIRPEVVLPTIVNDDNEEEEETTDTQQTTTTTRKNKKKKRGNQLDWTAVIARVQSHPREAGESYFVRSTPSSPDGPVPIVDPSTSSNNNNSNAAQEHTILTYKPLHAMLKYDPPLAAVQAVLKAHPHAALDVTFEGTALKIAAESRVSSSSVLRLLLVAEMAMRKKVLIEERLAKSRAEEADRDGNDDDKKEETIDSSSVVSAPAPPIIDNETLTNNFDLVTVLPSPSSSPSRMFVGHNPIRWIAESHIPRKSAALLLKWYPVGAFQRPRDDDGLPVEEIEQDYQDEDAMYSDSPLIEIIDDFASDQDVLLQEQRENHEVDDDDDAQEEEQDESASGEDDDDDDDSSTDLNVHETIDGDDDNDDCRVDGTRRCRGHRIRGCIDHCSIVHRVPVAPAPVPPQAARFHPVHAFIRCITNPNLGLEICRPYGVWSILRAMGQRIPSEFTAKDESDGNRTAFQTLAESPAGDCRLCIEEVRDVVECLMDADYRSAHLPRKSDGRLIVHVALENGWPCRDMLSRKTSATCA